MASASPSTKIWREDLRRLQARAFAASTMPFRFLICAIGILSMPCAAHALGGRLEAAQGEFRLRLDDGRVLAGEALAGARVVIEQGGETLQVLIDAVEEVRPASGK